MFSSILRRSTKSVHPKRLFSSPSSPCASSPPKDNMDKFVVFYLSGLAMTSITMLLGNIYNGFEMAHTSSDTNSFISEGFFHGISKMSYGIGSWGFPLYAAYRHTYRHKIAQNTENPKLLTAHWKMHLIPNSLYFVKCHELFKLTNYFTKKGIIDS